jgi:AraC family transcriptional regulator
MKPKIVQSDGMMFVGMVFYGNPFAGAGGWSEENEIGKLWGRFASYREKHEAQFKHIVNPEAEYEIHITTETYEETKEYYVMVGVAVSEIESLPLETFAKVFPPTTYAVFTLRGAQTTSNWSVDLYETWLPASGYEQAYDYIFECYEAERFKGMDDPESELDIYVPVKKKEGA